MKLKKTVVLGMLCLGVLGGTLGLAHPASAQVTCPDNTIRAKQKVDSYAECNTKVTDGKKSLTSRFTTAVNLGAGIVGSIAIVAIIVGAIFMTSSAGDPGKVKRGQMAILYGVVGLIIAFLAFAIVNFVIKGVFSGGSGDVTGSPSKSEEKPEDEP